MKMKFVSRLLIFLFCLLGFSANAYGEDTKELKYLQYEIKSGEVTITHCSSEARGNIVIPLEIEGYPVTVIGKEAFYNIKIDAITIPSTVKIIEDSAFEWSQVTTINMNEGLEEIGEGAFRYGKFETIVIPSTVKKIGKFAFADSNLTSITLSDSLEFMGEDVFSMCVYLEHIYHNHTYKTDGISKATINENGYVIEKCACHEERQVTTYKVNKFKLSATEYTYNGKVQTPKVYVRDSNNKLLVEGEDYKLTYSTGRKAAGTYSIKVVLKNRYSGSKTLNYVIYSKPKSIKLNKSSVALCVGQTSTLEAKVIPSTAKQKVTYSSSNKKVATVSSNGKITAKTQGTAVITVKTGNKIVSKCTVKVYKVKLNYSKKTINVKEKLTIKTNSSKYEVKKWTTSNSKVAKVSSKGVVTGTGNGKATITAYLKNGVVLKSTITVKKASLSKTASILKYETKKLTLKNASGTIKWKSSNTKVATVSSKGVVKGISKGTAVVTATCGGVKYTCKITVKHQDPVVDDYVEWKINPLTEAVEVIITMRNYSSKNVKKIDIYTTYRDRYGDLVYCNKEGISSCILKVDSGLKSKKTETFYWYPVMYNSDISRIDITKIIVTYSDGSKKTYNRNVFWHDSKYCG